MTSRRLAETRLAPASSTKASAICAVTNPCRRRCAARRAGRAARFGPPAGCGPCSRRLKPGDRHRDRPRRGDRGRRGSISDSARVEGDARAEREMLGAEPLQQRKYRPTQQEPAAAPTTAISTSSRPAFRRRHAAGWRRCAWRTASSSHAAAGADQKEIDDVDGTDQEQERARRPAAAAACGARRDVIGVQRDHHRAEAGIGHRLAPRMVGFERGIVRVDLRPGPGPGRHPGRSRAIICASFRNAADRRAFFRRRTRAADTARACEDRKLNSRGRTPTTVASAPSMRIATPEALGSALRRCRQKASVRIATRSSRTPVSAR